MDDDRQDFRHALERRLEALGAEERALRRQLDALRARLTEVERRRDVTTQLYAMEFKTDLAASRGNGTGLGPTRFASLTWEQAVEQALAEASTSVGVRQLWRILESGGFRTKSSDPLRTLRVVLSRHPNVSNPARGKYALVREEH